MLPSAMELEKGEPHAGEWVGRKDNSLGECCGTFVHCLKIYCCDWYKKELNDQLGKEDK